MVAMRKISAPELWEGSSADATTMGGERELGILQHHAMQHVGHVFATIDRVLQMVVDLLPLDEVHRIQLPKERLHRIAINHVALVFEGIDLRQTLSQDCAIFAAAQ